MSTETDWVLVKPTRTLNGPAVIYRGPSAKSCAVVRFNSAAVKLLELRAGDRIAVYTPAKPGLKKQLAIGINPTGVSLHGKGGSLQCGAKAFGEALEISAPGVRYDRVKFSPMKVTASGPILALLNHIESELAP